uniref:Uncharacterized protein n=1 Tax=viral metagenome TaxID=1070528 RepID=A0A6C0JW57_9ZZZZ
MNANVLTTAINILARHIQPVPAAAAVAVPTTNHTNVLVTSIAILQASMNKTTTASASGPTVINHTVTEGQLRRGNVEMNAVLDVADTTDYTKPHTETKLYSVDINPKYSNNPRDDPTRPESYTINTSIGGIVDRTAELDDLNAELIKRQKEIDDLTSKVKATAATLAGP